MGVLGSCPPEVALWGRAGLSYFGRAHRNDSTACTILSNHANRLTLPSIELMTHSSSKDSPTVVAIVVAAFFLAAAGHKPTIAAVGAGAALGNHTWTCSKHCIGCLASSWQQR